MERVDKGDRYIPTDMGHPRTYVCHLSLEQEVSIQNMGL